MRRRQIRIVLYRPRMYKRAVIREKRIKTSVLYSNFSIILLIVYDRDLAIETKFPLDYIIDKKKKKKEKCNNWQKNMSVFKVPYKNILIEIEFVIRERRVDTSPNFQPLNIIISLSVDFLFYYMSLYIVFTYVRTKIHLIRIHFSSLTCNRITNY